MNTTEKILKVFDSFRMAPLSFDEYETKGKQILRERIEKFVAKNEPIKFSMMGFPMKSPNDRDKVLGKLPDMAEQVTLQTFKDFNKEIKEIYSPGIIISVVSDGLVFNHVMRVSENVVINYQEKCIEMIGDAPINWYNLKDFYSGALTTDTMREKLITQFGITPTELERRILMDVDTNMLYRGMIKFMNLDLAIRDFSSNTQLQKEAKYVAKEMMHWNEAYSALVREEFSDHIRLSMHNSVNNGTKFSFQLIRSEGNIFTSAWHSALAVVNGVYETIHKKDAIAQGYELVTVNGQPFNFQK